MEGKPKEGIPVSRPKHRKTMICPHCEYAVQHTDNYCRKCGIKLDWSDYNGKSLSFLQRETHKMS